MTLALTKSQRRSIKTLHDSKRPKIQTCLLALGVNDSDVTHMSFEKARRNWIMMASECRIDCDSDREADLNVAWTQLKHWRCAVCGGKKPRTRNEVCSNRSCIQTYKQSRIRKKAGPVVLRFHAKNRKQTSSYCGHELRRAQYDLLKKTLEKTGFNVSETARRLKMSLTVCKYYIRKFSL